MRVSRIGFVVLAGLCPLITSLGACGSTNNDTFGNNGTSSGGGSGGGNGGSGAGTSSGGSILFGDGGTSSGGADGGGSSGPTVAKQTVLQPDCQGCSFPPLGAAACASAPPITLVYPSNNILVPPNMGLISVQWKPNGSPYTTFEVDFSSPPNTDWRIITKCSQYQTTDMQTTPATATGGCDLPIQGASWSFLSGANRGGNPVQVTVRGTTDGNCATSSNSINMSFAQEDLLGTYYYWKSTVSANGTGGQIWSKLFGAPATAEVNVTSSVATANRQTLNATCNGCHALSRDGSRMVVYSDDDDSDDEYSDIGGSLLDLTQMPATEIGVGVTGMRAGGQPVGFTALDPLATLYLTSNGLPLPGTGAPGGVSTSAGYTTGIPANAVSLWNAQGALVGPVSLATAPTRPTMPDWSIDGTSVVYVQPQAVAHWDPNGGGGFTGSRDDDDHIFGGSLYTVKYTGNSSFSAPTLFLQSAGENNYYPSYSPDATSSSPPQFIIFNRAPLDMTMGSLTACTGGAAPTCPNDSFSNPAARLMLANANAPGQAPIDLENANGSSAANPIPWSNSYPRWAPFVQTYKGSKILWFTFSSTRDYGLRILNHKTGMYQCYPADAYQTPGGAHGGRFGPLCQEPQLWMAPLTFGENAGTRDPSFPAFWLPYQDMTTHNHTAQWTEQVGPPTQPPTNCTCSNLGGPCGSANSCGCCSGMSLICSGSNTCIAPPT